MTRENMARSYYVYILASRQRRLYIGVTSDLLGRLHHHRTNSAPHFTRRYNITRLVYVETTSDVRAAIAREKQLKGWLRSRKVALIENVNPRWADLSETWTAPERSS